MRKFPNTTVEDKYLKVFDIPIGLQRSLIDSEEPMILTDLKPLLVEFNDSTPLELSNLIHH